MRRFILAMILCWAALPVMAQAQYAGSQACQRCHEQIYQRWQRTRMANVVQDPKARPQAVLGDFSKPDPLVTFRLEDVVFTYGSRWKQRYFTRRGDDYFVFPAQWDVQAGRWRRYDPSEEWWATYYPSDQMQRPTGPLCDGCHSVNYDIETKMPTEWNVGCERCHGPGAEHVRAPTQANIVNPSRLDFVRANDICISCHSQGRPRRIPIGDKVYDWPVGYQPGDLLADFWELEEHKLGEENNVYFPDGSAHKNRMQGNDFVQSGMYLRGVRCFNCHDTHGTANPAETWHAGDQQCLQCHGPQSPAGPRGMTRSEHTHHTENGRGSSCIACHMPAIARTIGETNVRSHTFRVLSPAVTASNGMPSACAACHLGPPEFFLEEIRKWPGVSPWRMSR
jgi:predicted CXXCH cytochrome family protein